MADALVTRSGRGKQLAYKDIDNRLYQRTTDVHLDISTGEIPGHITVNKFGRNVDVDTASVPEDVWTGGGIWIRPTQARIHDIASTDAADAAAGTGAQTLRVFGLPDWDTAEITEDITFNGITNVPTTNAYVIIYRMRCLTFGSGEKNAGLITATAQTDGTVTARIEIGKGQTQMAIYGIPSTQTFFAYDYYAAINRAGGAAASVDIEFLANDNPNTAASGWRVVHHLGLSTAGTSFLQPKFTPPVAVSGPTILKIQVENSSANDADISAGFNGILRTN